MRAILTSCMPTALQEVAHLQLNAQVIFQSAHATDIAPLLAALAARHPSVVCFCDPRSEHLHDLFDQSLHEANDDESLTTFHPGIPTAEVWTEFINVHLPMASDTPCPVAIQIGPGDLQALL